MDLHIHVGFLIYRERIDEGMKELCIMMEINDYLFVVYDTGTI